MKKYTKYTEMFKIITMKNVHIMYSKCTLQFAIGIKSIQLFKRYSKEKLICLIKLLFIKVRCLINVDVSLEANLEGQGW